MLSLQRDSNPVKHTRVKYCEYAIALFIFCCLNGCITSQVRYTRPSHRTPAIDEQQSVQKESVEKEQPVPDGAESFETRLKRVVDSYMGVPYREGGTTRKGMDCSGFVWRVYTDLGKKNFVRSSSRSMYRLGRRILPVRVKPGDLVFFKGTFRVNHVGIYMGNNMFAHASAKTGISYTSLDDEYFSQHFVGIRRLW